MSPNVSLNLGSKAEIRIREVKINSAKPAAVELPKETQRKRVISTPKYSDKGYQYSCRVKFDSAYKALLRFHIMQALDKVASGEELSWAPETI